MRSLARKLCLGVSCETKRSQSSSVRNILEQVKNGHISLEEAQDRLEGGRDKTLREFANLDHSRSSRAGFPEAVFAQGKTAEQVHAILESMAERSTEGTPLLATRVSTEMYNSLSSFEFQQGTIQYHPLARIVEMKRLQDASASCRDIAIEPRRRVVVATAGTTDIPVAEEAAVTLEATQLCEVDRVYDVGVAGLHRILQALPVLSRASCVIVAAGMDGALPSVVGGLVKVPVVAVPTSVGYGASFGGISAMLTMMNSCSPGVGVVNIDNGFGAAAMAYKCLSIHQERRHPPADM